MLAPTKKEREIAMRKALLNQGCLMMLSAIVVKLLLACAAEAAQPSPDDAIALLKEGNARIVNGTSQPSTCPPDTGTRGGL